MKTIIIIDGIDGTGKTTLSNEIERRLLLNNPSLDVKEHHASFDKSWDMEEYHREIVSSIDDHDVLILDRLVASEYAYGHAFRDGPSYDVFELSKELSRKYNVIHIHADNQKSIENFSELKETREEMFDDSNKMTAAKGLFNDFYYCLNERVIKYDYNLDNYDLIQSLVNRTIEASYELPCYGVTYIKEKQMFHLFRWNYKCEGWYKISQFTNETPRSDMTLKEIYETYDSLKMYDGSNDFPSEFKHSYVSWRKNCVHTSFSNGGEWDEAGIELLDKTVKEVFGVK